MMCAKYTGIIYMCVDLLILFFFFKQKTAYEMRISDWSSDVCSSDLGPARAFGADGIPGRINRGNATRGSNDGRIYRRDGPYFGPREICALWQGDRRPERAVRSEEHTSELQSLMRISYAVSCLKKKKQHKDDTSRPTDR